MYTTARAAMRATALVALLLLCCAPTSDAKKKRKAKGTPAAPQQQAADPAAVTDQAGGIDEELRLQAEAVTAAFGGEGWRSTKSSVIGIDLGTTHAAVAVAAEGGRVEIIANELGSRATPFVVSFADGANLEIGDPGEVLIGEAARGQAATNPKNTIYDSKRLIGRKFKDKSVKTDRKRLPFEIVDKDDNKPYIKVDVAGEVRTLSPEEVSAIMLAKMKETAEAHLGAEVRDAVVTVPAYFSDAQRQATKDAGSIAGLNVRRVITEPTAAAMAYGLDKGGVGGERTILVFHLGGGTFDLTLLNVDDGVFEVVASNGDTRLGGDDFDERTTTYFTKVFQKKTGADLSGDKPAVHRLRRAVEQAKRTLSTAHTARVELAGLHGGHDLSEELTRSRFEELNAKLFQKVLGPIKKVLQEGGVEKGEVDEILLVGGSARIPKLQSLVKEYFGGKEPNKGINPDEVVAYGAAVQAVALPADAEPKKKALDPALAAKWQDLAVLESVTGLAATLGKAGRGSEALALYETCAETNPKEPGVLVAYGSALGTAGRLPEAEDLLGRAVALSPPERLANALQRHALSLAKLKRMDEALDAYTRAVDASASWPNPKARAQLITQRAMALRASQRGTEAAAAARQALELDPTLKAAKTIAAEGRESPDKEL